VDYLRRTAAINFVGSYGDWATGLRFVADLMSEERILSNDDPHQREQAPRERLRPAAGRN